MKEREYGIVAALLRLRQAKELIGSANVTLERMSLSQQCRDLLKLIEELEREVQGMVVP